MGHTLSTLNQLSNDTERCRHLVIISAWARLTFLSAQEAVRVYWLSPEDLDELQEVNEVSRPVILCKIMSLYMDVRLESYFL